MSRHARSVTEYPAGTRVIYDGTLRYYQGDTLTVIGPCDCPRCPCTEPDCLPHSQPHYELADDRGQVMAHARHSNLRPDPETHR